MKTIVFAGPSVFDLDVRAFPHLEFHPPAASGDILAAVDRGATAIGLIDGLYGDRAAVWHKEILYALSKDIPVAGAASMGALRAAECEPFGMIGIGEVFRAYRNGVRTSDADVAIVHAPAELGYRPLTIALVDAEATIGGMSDALDDKDITRLLNAARRQHFSVRTWKSIVAQAGLDPGLTKTLAGNAISVKQTDALQLLTALRDEGLSRENLPRWAFQDTLFFRSMAACRRGWDRGKNG